MNDEVLKTMRALVGVLENESVAPSASIGVARVGITLAAFHLIDDDETRAFVEAAYHEKKGPKVDTPFARYVAEARTHFSLHLAAWGQVAAALGLPVGDPVVFEHAWAGISVVEAERILERLEIL